MYEQQNIYLNGILKRRETERTNGHPRRANPTVTANGKRVGRPPAEDSSFAHEYYIRNEKGESTYEYAKRHFAPYMALVQRGC